MRLHNLTSFSLAAAALVMAASANHSIAATIAVSGFNADLVVEAAASAPYADDAEAIDIPNNWAFLESGLEGNAFGFPAGGTLVADNTGTVFELDYSSNNALLLTTSSPVGTLTLDTPTQLSSLNVLATSAQGGGNGLLLVNYDDGTYQLTDFGAPDWFFQDGGTTAYGNTYTHAMQGLGRINLNDDAIQDNGDNPDLFETVIPLDGSKAVASLLFTRALAGGGSTATAVFAVSGQVVPEPMSAMLLAGGAVLLFGARRWR